MPGKRRLNRDVGCFRIAYFTDQYDIRVNAQYRPEPAGEGDTGTGVDLNLVNILKPVFNGVFHGNDIAPDMVKAVERGIKGGGFTSSSRATNHNDAIRHLKHVFKLIQAFGQK